MTPNYCGNHVKLDPLYRIRFTYPEGWEITLASGLQQHFTSPKVAVKALSPGRFRACNYPVRRGEGAPFCPDFSRRDRNR